MKLKILRDKKVGFVQFRAGQTVEVAKKLANKLLKEKAAKQLTIK